MAERTRADAQGLPCDSTGGSRGELSFLCVGSSLKQSGLKYFVLKCIDMLTDKCKCFCIQWTLSKYSICLKCHSLTLDLYFSIYWYCNCNVC